MYYDGCVHELVRLKVHQLHCLVKSFLYFLPFPEAAANHTTPFPPHSQKGAAFIHRESKDHCSAISASRYLRTRQHLHPEPPPEEEQSLAHSYQTFPLYLFADAFSYVFIQYLSLASTLTTPLKWLWITWLMNVLTGKCKRHLVLILLDHPEALDIPSWNLHSIPSPLDS